MSAIITVGVYEGNPDSGLGSVVDHLMETQYPSPSLPFNISVSRVTQGDFGSNVLLSDNRLLWAKKYRLLKDIATPSMNTMLSGHTSHRYLAGVELATNI